MGKTFAIDDRAQLHKDANRALDQNLAPGEIVRVIIRGSYDAAIIATDRRAFVFKKGMLSGAGLGQRLNSYDYRNLTGVQLETGMVTGNAGLEGPGLRIAGDAGDARVSPNALILQRSDYDQAREGVAILRRLIAEHHAPLPAAPDAADQLRKLGELRDAGVLTPEEFTAKKAELLARL